MRPGVPAKRALSLPAVRLRTQVRFYQLYKPLPEFLEDVEIPPKRRITHDDKVGVAKALSLDPVAERDLPGLEFDLATRQLNIRPHFDLASTFVVRPPWLSRTQLRCNLVRRGADWCRNTLTRNTPAAHWRHALVLRDELFKFANSSLQWGVIHSSLGPTIDKGTMRLAVACISPQNQGLEQRVKKKDGALAVEYRGDPIPGLAIRQNQGISLYWIELNVDYRLFEQSYLWAQRYGVIRPHPSSDLLFVQLNRFADYLQMYAPERPEAKDGAWLRLRGSIMRTHLKGEVVPVVLAVRGIFLYFLWTGGLQGRFVLQYAGNLLLGTRPDSMRPPPPR